MGARGELDYYVDDKKLVGYVENLGLIKPQGIPSISIQVLFSHLYSTMYLSSVTALALLLAPAAAKTCVNQTIPIQVSARQAIFDLAVPQTSLEATDFILNVTQQGRNFTNTVLTGYNTTIGTYNISTQFCLPSSNGTNATSPSTLQILTHGIGFDKTYVPVQAEIKIEH